MPPRRARSSSTVAPASGIPLVVLVDTPGFMPGTRQEGAGVIRYGAQLLRSFAAAAVPKLTVIMRKAYGGAVITMNSRDLGADMVFAWPDAEIGIMAARQAVGITERRTIEAAPDPAEAQDELADEYAAEHLTASAAAVSGFVDEVIEPEETRARLTWALALPGGPAMKTYVALGDSFTAGTGCAPGESWADLLAERSRGATDSIYENLAEHGATSADVRRQVSRAIAARARTS